MGQEIPSLDPSAAEDEKRRDKADKRLISLERVRLALERLQLAWLRVTITLSVFGFTIYRLLESKIQSGRQPVLGFITGREIALFMISIGTVGLLFASYQHIKSLGLLKRRYENMPASVSLGVGYVILAFSVFMLLVVLFRL